MTSSTIQTTGFMDSASGIEVGPGATHTDMDLADAVINADLADYLSRPVRISSFTWSMSDTVGVLNTVLPWSAYMSHPSITNKLTNYAFLRGNLKVKYVVNASPFYYGSMRACYQPLQNFKPATIVAGSVGPVQNTELIPYSQQPGVWIKPSHSEGAELTLPFFLPRSFLRVQSLTEAQNMGILRNVIYNPLLSANGATGSVSVQVYAWMEDVVLAGPTVGIALQADEYGLGPVSLPATTIASMASKLRTVPIIGKYATATEIGARAAAGIAQLFGMSNPPVIENTTPLRPSPFPQMASPELSYPVEKLTLDPKNELSIDPSIVGLTSEDELAIQNFVTKQSYVTGNSWTTSMAADTPLFTAKVNTNFGVGSTTTGGLVQYTPLALAAKQFRAWRGDIIFTFRFIATPFHKGRVRISYDPANASVQTTADTGPYVFNRIVDLGAETEVDIRIPYQQALPWCYNYSQLDLSNWTTSASPALTFQDTFDNGVISVKVLTALSAPVTTSSVGMQVFVRGAENLELANPTTLVQQETAFVLQSEEYSEKREGAEEILGNSDAGIMTTRARVNFGENVGSLRTLLRRSNLLDSIVPQTNTTNLGFYTITQTRYPAHYGYDPAGFITVKGTTVPASNFLFNSVNMTPWHYISNCFVAQRGSMHWHYNWEGPTEVTMRATRYPLFYPGTNAAYVGSTAGSFSKNVYTLNVWNTPSSAGTALTNQTTNAGLSVSVPNASVFKFQSTSPTQGSAPAGTSSAMYDGSVYEGFTVEIVNNGVADELSRGRLERYFAIGTDYTLMFFLNCPTMRYLPISGIVPV
nr:MAG: hypothetical protein 2 [Locarnavirus sp.]